MPLMDCDAPVTPEPIVSDVDIAKRLSLLWPNLFPFRYFTFAGSLVGGAYTEDPFSEYGNQKRALILPGGSATPVAQVLNAVYGAATVGHNGGAYNMSFYAYLRGGGTSGTFKGGFRDYLDGTLSASDFSDYPATYSDASVDKVFNVTDTPTLFTWELIASDDTDFFAASPNNAILKFFVDTSSDIPAGSELVITEFQLQTTNFFAPWTTHLPWRPNPNEKPLSMYVEYILNTNYAELLLKPNFMAMADPSGSNLVLVPSGVRRVIRILGTSYALGTDPIIPGAYLRPENAAETTITFTTEATHGLKPESVISVRAQGAEGFVISEDPGVTVYPNLQGLTGSRGQYDVVQYLYLGSDEWDTI